jgi:hypothetical protein
MLALDGKKNEWLTVGLSMNETKSLFNVNIGELESWKIDNSDRFALSRAPLSWAVVLRFERNIGIPWLFNHLWVLSSHCGN